MVWVSGWADGHRGFLVFFHGKLLCRFCFALCYIVLPYSLLVWTVKEEMDISTTSRLTALFSPDLGSDRPDSGESGERLREGESGETLRLGLSGIHVQEGRSREHDDRSHQRNSFRYVGHSGHQRLPGQMSTVQKTKIRTLLSHSLNQTTEELHTQKHTQKWKQNWKQRKKLHSQRKTHLNDKTSVNAMSTSCRGTNWTTDTIKAVANFLAKTTTTHLMHT